MILTGLFGTMTSSLLFGLSTSFTWAILSRSLCGILNGNVGVIKSMLAEITDETNQGMKEVPYLVTPNHIET